MENERFHSVPDAWQAEERENHHLSPANSRASQTRGTSEWCQNWGASDLTAEIAPNGKDRFNEGISHDIKEFEVCFDHQGGGRLIP